MYVLHKCDICGTRKILNVQARVGATRKRTRLKDMEILEVIEEEVFRNSIRPVVRLALKQGMTIKEMKKFLKSECGMCESFADESIEYLKNIPEYVNVENGRFVITEELTV